MDNIYAQDFFTYQEQVEWNRLKDLYIYVQNIQDIDTNYLDMLNTLIEGFVMMMNEDNKIKIFDCIKDLLESTQHRHVTFENDHNI